MTVEIQSDTNTFFKISKVSTVHTHETEICPSAITAL